MVSSARVAAPPDPRAKDPRAKDQGGKALQLELLLAEKKVKQLEVEEARCAEIEAENHRLARRLQMARQSREQRESALREQISQRRDMLARLQEESTIMALEEASSDQRVSDMAAEPPGKALTQELRNSHWSVTRAMLGRAGDGRKCYAGAQERRDYTTIEKDGHLLLTAVELEAIDVCYNVGSPEVGKMGVVPLHPAPAAQELKDISHYLVHMWEDMAQKTTHMEAFHAERAPRLEREVSRVREQTGKVSATLEHALMELAIEEFVKQELLEKNVEFSTIIQEIAGISEDASSAEANTGLKARAGGQGRRSLIEEARIALDRASGIIHQVDKLRARVQSQAPDVWPALFQHVTCELRALRAEGGRMRTKLAAAQLAKERETQPGPRLKKLERSLESELFSIRDKVAQLLIDVEPLAEWTAAVEAMIAEFQPGQSEPLDVPCAPEVHQALAQIQQQLEELAPDSFAGEEWREQTAPAAKESITQTSVVSAASSSAPASGAARDTIAQSSDASAGGRSSVASTGNESMWAGLGQAETSTSVQALSQPAMYESACTYATHEGNIRPAPSPTGSDESQSARIRLDGVALSSAGSDGSQGGRSRAEMMHEQELRIREQVRCVVEEALSNVRLQEREMRIKTQVQAVMEDTMSRLSGAGGEKETSAKMPGYTDSGSSSSLSEARRGEAFDISNLDETRITRTQCPHPTNYGSEWSRVFSDGLTHSSEQSVAHNVDKFDRTRFSESLADEFVQGFTDGAVALVDADIADSNAQQKPDVTSMHSSSFAASDSITANNADAAGGEGIKQNHEAAAVGATGLDMHTLSDEAKRSIIKDQLQNLAQHIRRLSQEAVPEHSHAQKESDGLQPSGTAASSSQPHSIRRSCRDMAQQLFREIYASISRRELRHIVGKEVALGMADSVIQRAMSQQETEAAVRSLTQASGQACAAETFSEAHPDERRAAVESLAEATAEGPLAETIAEVQTGEDKAAVESLTEAEEIEAAVKPSRQRRSRQKTIQAEEMEAAVKPLPETSTDPSLEHSVADAGALESEAAVKPVLEATTEGSFAQSVAEARE